MIARAAAHQSAVSVLYREPKVLKARYNRAMCTRTYSVSVLYREPKVLKLRLYDVHIAAACSVSVLYREPKVLKPTYATAVA